MSLSKPGLPKVICIFLLFFVLNNANAQQEEYKRILSRIDSLTNLGLPKSAIIEVDKLDSLSRVSNQPVWQVKAAVYRMIFQAFLEENALVTIISRLKKDIDQAPYPVKPVLQSILAETYWKYYQANRYQFIQRSALLTPDQDFTRWDLQTIINETSRLYQLSLKDIREKTASVTILGDGLTGDSTNRYLRPTLYDLLAHRALDFFLSEEPALTKPRLPFSLNDDALFNDHQAFAEYKMQDQDTASVTYQGMKLLQDLTIFHIQRSEKEALADIDLKRFEFLYRKLIFNNSQQPLGNQPLYIINGLPANTLGVSEINSDDIASISVLKSTEATAQYGPQAANGVIVITTKSGRSPGISSVTKDLIYITKLKRIAEDNLQSNISADAWFQLARYYESKDSLVTAMNYARLAAEKFPSSTGGRNAETLIRSISRKTFQAQLEEYNLPGESILASLSYRNIPKLSVRVYKLSQSEYQRLIELQPKNPVPYRPQGIVPDTAMLTYLGRLKPVQQQSLELPGTADYKSHLTEFRLNQGEAGRYVVLLKDEFSPDTALIQMVSYAISNLAYSVRQNPDGQMELLVADRKTGKPLSGISVKVDQYEANVVHPLGIWETGKEGKLLYTTVGRSREVKLTLIDGRDSIVSDRLSVYGPVTNAAAERIVQSTVLFADRQIYRPGQTIWFKGLQLLREGNKSSIVPGQSIDVKLIDPNNKEISLIKVVTNDFGTFSGSFILPQNVLNGSFSIRTVNGQIAVGVEEYKRPTFSINFDPVKETYRFNDSVIVRGKARALAGYGLSKARVAYHIVRTSNPGPYYINTGSRIGIPQTKRVEFASDTILTDDNGGYVIKFKAVLDNGDNLNWITYTYNISATVIDNAGETRTAQASVVIGKQVVRVNALIGPKTIVSDSLKIPFSFSNLNNQSQSGVLKAKIYSLQQPDKIFRQRFWQLPDQYLMNENEFKRYFPSYTYKNEDVPASWKVGKLVYEQSVNITDKQPGYIPVSGLNELPSAIYLIELSAINVAGDTCSAKFYTTLLTENTGKSSRSADWVLSKTNKTEKGYQAEFYVGLGEPSLVLMEVYDGPSVRTSEWLKIGKEQKKISVVYTGTEKPNVQFLSFSDSRIYLYSEQLIGDKEDKKLDLRFITYRDKLQPGETEQWKLQVKGLKGEKESAEMVAALYDASLNTIRPKSPWEVNTLSINNPLYSRWNSYSIRPTVSSLSVKSSILRDISGLIFNYGPRQYEKLNMLGFAYYGGVNYYFMLGKLGGVIVDKDGKVTADGKPVTRITVNGKDYFGGDLQSAMRNIPSNAISGLQTIDNYGSQANFSGAMIGSARAPAMESVGPLDEVVVTAYGVTKERRFDDPQALQQQEIPIRSNFNETAFFYPQLKTNEEGEILVEFTIPESLTRWQFRGFAHTKELKTGYIESEVVTSKQLMISANMPRFLREGDTVTVSARLANLTTEVIKGQAGLQLFNALNMQPVSLLMDPADAKQTFETAGGTNKAISFRLVVPSGLDALAYRLTADGGKHTDGEENTLAVLPNRMMVTESMPVMVRAGQTKSFTFDKLVNQSSKTLTNKTLTLEYTQNPVWYAVQAIPYLMEFPYECSEAMFSRYYSNSLATNIISRFPLIKTVFDQWKNTNSTQLLSNLEKNQELKSVLITETPWLRDAQSETEQKKRIALLFDLNNMSNELEVNLSKLSAMQMPDGGFPWFAGSRYADRYITQHILAGIGQLYHLGIADAKNLNLKRMSDKSLQYIDNILLSDYGNQQVAEKIAKPPILNGLAIHAWYGRSYYSDRALNANLTKALEAYLAQAELEWKSRSVYEQGMIALTMQRFKKTLEAEMIVRSLNETAQHSDDMGMYWAKNQPGWYWYQSPVETQSLMIELFGETSGDQKAIEEMKIWLLRNKQTSNWKTTKATAAACYALLLKGEEWRSTDNSSEISLDHQLLSSLKPETKADAGSGYIKTVWTEKEIVPGLGKIEVKNSGKTISWGAMYWQYFENLDKITSAETKLKLERKYFIQQITASGPVLTAVDAHHIPKTGDLLKVVVYLESDRDYEYVQLKDMRPSGTEPTDVLSGYKYQDRLYYYQVTKDAATNFFISNLPKGKYVFEYNLRVSQPGNFSTGISSIQSLYAPEFSAHSQGERIVFK